MCTFESAVAKDRATRANIYRHFRSERLSNYNPIIRNHGKGPRIPRSCRKGQVSDTKGTIYFDSGDGSGDWEVGQILRETRSLGLWQWRIRYIRATMSIIADGFISTGWASRKEKDPQGPRKEENYIHPPIRERYAHWWQEEGSYRVATFPISNSDKVNRWTPTQPHKPINKDGRSCGGVWFVWWRKMNLDQNWDWCSRE